ncbi:uncharacterized protein N7446_010324 [Penicillium canescens]|uniref:uncharacterized protein n=1 Tax=Penicillium canescens TaxID=5083 RepID=UPI0026DF9521|nr:uncharacterized protein N7446_010324 [Penicillium canescens]KAJ6037686.1 hypothetical protein N7444_010391 [Penicillium canescens]KAJ6054312.1 hypothetical protein N7446_010324 [Penicillium canescens]
MRFGQNFHQYLVPEWAPFYVPYPLLKKLFKTAAGNSIGESVHPDFSDVYTLLTESIDSFNNFHNKNCNLLTERQTHLCTKYASVPREYIFLGKKDGKGREKLYLLQAVAEIRHDFEKLQDYFRVNEEAIHRIYAKIEKSTGFVEQFHQRHKASWVKSKIGHHTCLNFMRRLDDLTTSVLGGPSNREAPSKIMQSCYEKAFPANDVVLDNNLLNHVITMCSREDGSKMSGGLSKESQCVTGGQDEERGVDLFNFAVCRLGIHQKNALLAEDTFGRLCLHYGAIYGLPSSSHEAQCQNLWNRLNGLLIIAIRYQHDDMVFLLGKNQIEFQGCRSIHGESALYVAAQIGREDYVKLLLENGKDLYLDIPETLHGWTPLFIACVEGHKTVAQLLLQAGANQDIHDHLGWVAKEHAALRGYLSLAEMLRPWDMSQLTGGPASHCQPWYPTDWKKEKAVDLKGLLPEKTKYTSKLASLDMSISMEGNDSTLLKLPILSDVVNEPFVFPVLRPSEARLVFKFFRVDDSCEGLQLVGSAAALLESGGDCFGANRESLVRARTIPILEKKTMDVMGTVTFTFVIAKPVMNLNLPTSAHRSTTEGALQLVGHRGLGQNTINHSRIQLGENTIESFLSAAKQGASCVEFDVQLTRDLVPVVYHDFSLSESGTDIPIHDLSFEQFMYANQLRSPRGIPTQELKNMSAQYMSDESGREKIRSRSLTRFHAQETRQHQDRMKYTVDFMKKGLKPNTRGHCVQDSFTTLEQLLVELPESISFNIEIKYPRLHEAVEAGVAPISIEINTFINEILAHVCRVKSGRRIMLSSFSPEVCILLAIKQNTYPVLFITNAGKLPISDMEIRASSLQAAVRFAKRWDLNGIVFSSETLVMCPRLVGYVKNSGLICGSYGPLNNVSENSKIQKEAGIQMLMVDEVGSISKALNGTANCSRTN